MSEEGSDKDDSPESSGDEDFEEEEGPRKEKAQDPKRAKRNVSTKADEPKGVPTTIPLGKPSTSAQSNIHKLTEQFEWLEMLAEHTLSSREKAEAPMCFMCGERGHLVKQCLETEFFLDQGICHLDMEMD